MSARPDPLGAYRQAVAEARAPAAIIRAARLCSGLSLDDAMPALLATASRSDDLFDRWAAQWVKRYRQEFDPKPDEREVALVEGALRALPGFDTTAAIAADALAQFLELRGMDYGRAAVVRFSDRLP